MMKQTYAYDAYSLNLSCKYITYLRTYILYYTTQYTYTYTYYIPTIVYMYNGIVHVCTTIIAHVQCTCVLDTSILSRCHMGIVIGDNMYI